MFTGVTDYQRIILEIRDKIAVTRTELKNIEELLRTTKRKRVKEETCQHIGVKRQKTSNGTFPSSNDTTTPSEKKKRITSLQHQEESALKESNLLIKDRINDVLSKHGIVQHSTLIGQHCQRFLCNHESILCDMHEIFSESKGHIPDIDTFIVEMAELCELLESIFYFLFRCDIIATEERI